MSTVRKLRAEFASDGTYAALSIAEVLTRLKTEDINRNRDNMYADELLANFDPTEFATVRADAEKRDYLLFLLTAASGPRGVDPFGIAQTIIVRVFGGGSTTVTNLGAARVELISRETELGLGDVQEGHVAEARRA